MRPSLALPAAGALLLLAALTAGVLELGLVRDVDWQVHLWVDAHLQGDLARGISKLFSLFGQRGVVVIPLLVMAVLAARRTRSVRPLLVTVVVLAGIALSVWLFKSWVGRVAPGTGRDAVHAGGLSYPGGHAVNALVCWALIVEFAAALGPRAARVLTVRRRWAIAAFAALAAGIGMTTLDYHWLSDTVAGWLLGTLILVVVLNVGAVAPSNQPGRVSPTTPQAPARPAPSG